MQSVQTTIEPRFWSVIGQQALVQLNVETPNGETLLQGSEFIVCNAHHSLQLIHTYQASGIGVVGQKLVSLFTGEISILPTLQSAPIQLPVPLLRAALLQFFPDAQFSDRVDVDPEEGWARPVLVVATGVDEFDDRFAREQQFYTVVRADAALTGELRRTSVLFE